MARDSRFRRLHGMTPIPPGKTFSDLLPTYAGAENEVHLGEPNSECASCRKPFNTLRKRRKAVRMYPVRSKVPVAFAFDICGACLALYQAGGASRDGVLAAVESYCDGVEATQ
ncbi:MAG: hypothetical protein H6R16_3519 [Proteobacteria bacterium]|nr:hypothetical protein [Pseudomonadota bacterium]